MFEGNFEETKKYFVENFKNSRWNCPTGAEDLEGIIDVLYAGTFDGDKIIEVDFVGNIKCQGDKDIFANIIQE